MTGGGSIAGRESSPGGGGPHVPRGWYEFLARRTRATSPGPPADSRQPVAVFSNVEDEYRALRDGAGVVDRRDRARLIVEGEDRAAWLHNLTTNQIIPLGVGDGNDAYVLDARGRILFDVTALVLPGEIRLDLDARVLARARAHLSRYVIMEDVRLREPDEPVVRLALVGPAAGEVLSGLGAPQAMNIAHAQASRLDWEGHSIRFFRSDYCGPPAFDLMIPPPAAESFWSAVTAEGRAPRAVPAGADAVRVHRIESGVAASVSELNEEALPGEVGHGDRWVSTNKGCYLGQEIVERMRSRGAVARRLVGVRIDAAPEVPPPGATLYDGDRRVGAVTSACRSIALGVPIGLAFVAAGSAAAGRELMVAGAEDARYPARVVDTPFVE